MTLANVGVRLVRVLTIALATVAGAMPAAAQVQPVTAYFAVVTADETPLRCGDKEVLYPVARLTKGTLLRVDGQGGGWLRVAYPPGVVACIGADVIQLDSTGKAGALTKESRLKHFNMTSGYKGSWNTMLERPLPAGTTLTLADPEPINDGRGNAGYKIVPPEQARAFIQEGAVTRATQTQIDTYMAALTPKPADSGKPSTADKTVKPTDQPGTNTKPPETIADKPTDTPVDKPTDKPAPEIAVKPVEIPKSPWEKLEAAFEAVRKQPVESAEYTALIGEFQSAIDKLEDTPQNATVRRRLVQRHEYLKLQVDVQAAARRVAESQHSLTLDEQKLADRMKEVERTRQYTIVGRLSASTIYDGKRLPLMFRIMAIGGQSSRTLAYIKPNEKLKIENKLGHVVGVLGESRLDPTLKSNVITPLRVDTLEAAPAVPPATTEPAPAAPAPTAEVPPGGGPGGG